MKFFQKHRALSNVWQIDLTGIGVCLLMLAVVYWLGVTPLIRQAKAMASQKQQVVDVTQRSSQLIALRGGLKKKLAKAERAVDAAAFELRPVRQLNQYLSHLTQLAAASDLTLHEIQPGKPVLGPHYWSVPVTMSGTGRYRTSAQFLHRLHDSLPNTRLSSLQLTALAGDAYQPKASFQLGFVWHAALERKDMEE